MSKSDNPRPGPTSDTHHKLDPKISTKDVMDNGDLTGYRYLTQMENPSNMTEMISKVKAQM